MTKKHCGNLMPHGIVFKLKIALMKVVLHVKDQVNETEFMEIIGKLDYVEVMMQVKDQKTSQFISDLAESFSNVKEYENGKKQLKSAKDLLNEF
jgi:hypothetical protein